MLAMKRMIRYAAENGFDRISWTTGQQQADRYDLSQQVDQIGYRKNADGTYALDVIKRGNEFTTGIGDHIPEDKLESYVGKDVASRIINDEGSQEDETGFRTLVGDGLKIGGEGMKAFYDKMLPNELNKYIKQFGAKVDEGAIPTGNSTWKVVEDPTYDEYRFKVQLPDGGYLEEPGKGILRFTSRSDAEKKAQATFNSVVTPGVDITPKMRDAVMQGQPLFSRSPAGQADDMHSGSLGMPDETFTEKLVRLFQNDFNRVEKLQRVLLERGGKMSDLSDVALAQERSSGIIWNNLEHLDKETVQPIINNMRARGVSREEMDRYLMAKHAPERNEYIASINPDMPDGGSGMMTEEANNIVKEMEAGPNGDNLKMLAQHVYDMNRQTRESLLKGGLIDQETKDVWDNMYKYYVPLRGIEGEAGHPSTGQGFRIRSSGVKHALGRGEGNQATSPLAYSVAQAEDALVRSGKAEIGRSLMLLMLDNPDPNFWSISKRTYKQMLGLNGEMLNGFTEVPEGLVENIDYHRAFGVSPEEYARAAKEGRAPKRQVIYTLDPNYANRPDTFSAMVDGKEYLMTIKDETLVSQLKALKATQLRSIIGAFAAVNRYLAAVNTALNPEFTISNFERDIQDAMINMSGEHSAKMSGRILKYVPGAIRGIWQYTFDTKGHNEYRDLYEELRQQGGTVGFYGMEDIYSRMSRIDARIADAGDSYWASTKRGVRWIRDLVLDANIAVENGTRLATYRAARDEGLSKAQAASIAKNVTVNFNRRGEIGPALNAAYLFYNAGIQGPARILKALKYPATRRIVTGIAMASFGLAMYNQAVGGKDKEGISNWEKISPWTKGTNLVIMKPDGSGQYWKWRLPYGYNIFFYAGTALHDVMYSKTVSVIETVGHTVNTFLNGWNPIQGADVLDTITPTLFKPLEQYIRNMNFMGSDIRPENKFSPYPQPNSDKAFASTNPQLKEFAKWLNKVSGGDDTTSGYLDMSPEDIKFFTNWLTGGAGMFVYRTGTAAADLATGSTPALRDIPFVRSVTGRPSPYFDIHRYYTTLGQLAAIKAQVRIYQAGGEQTHLNEYMASHANRIKVVDGSRIIIRQVQNMNAQYRAAIADDKKDLAKTIQKRMVLRMQDLSARFAVAARLDAGE